MAYLPGQLYHFVKHRISSRNLKLLFSLFFNLTLLLLFNMLLFLFLMYLEGHSYTIIDAFYWTLTVFTTLGLGDIVFTGAIGRFFTIWVLVSGIAVFFIVIPYVFFQFFQSEARAPRSLKKKTKDHILIIGYNQISKALIEYLVHFKYEYALITSDLDLGLRLHDQDVNVVVGDLRDFKTYEQVGISKASMLVACASDALNVNVALTIREQEKETPLLATASAGRETIVKSAGFNRVVSLDTMMAKNLARRIISGDAIAHTIGVFDKFVIAESSAANTPIVGKALKECRLREMGGVNVIGVWDRGIYTNAGPDTVVGKNSILILAGSKEQIANFNAIFCIYNVSEAHVLIIGGGNVGLAVSQELSKRKISFSHLEKNLNAENKPSNASGSAACTKEDLLKAGIEQASAVIITTEDDDLSVYITLCVRHLRPDIQIISRSVLEQNISTLYSAGADFVLSYASMGANAILNILRGADMLILTEGLHVLRLHVPRKLAGMRIAETDVRAKTGCSILAVESEGEFVVNPIPEQTLPSVGHIYILGSQEEGKKFYDIYD